MNEHHFTHTQKKLKTVSQKDNMTAFQVLLMSPKNLLALFIVFTLLFFVCRRKVFFVSCVFTVSRQCFSYFLKRQRKECVNYSSKTKSMFQNFRFIRNKSDLHVHMLRKNDCRKKDIYRNIIKKILNGVRSHMGWYML